MVTTVPLQRVVAAAVDGHSTGTVIVQPPAGKGPAAAVPLVNVMVLPPAVAVRVPTVQVVDAAGEAATTSGEGSTSVKLIPAWGPADGRVFRLFMLIVRVVTPPGTVDAEAKLLLTLIGRPHAPPGVVAAATNAGPILPFP